LKTLEGLNVVVGATDVGTKLIGGHLIPTRQLPAWNATDVGTKLIGGHLQQIVKAPPLDRYRCRHQTDRRTPLRLHPDNHHCLTLPMSAPN